MKMIEVTHYIVTFSSGEVDIKKGFRTRTFVSDEIDLIIFRYEIALFFNVPIRMITLVSRVNIVKLWWGDLTITCKYMKYKRHNYNCKCAKHAPYVGKI